MTLAITANIILCAIAFAAIVGLLSWPIRTSSGGRPASRRGVRFRASQPPNAPQVQRGDVAPIRRSEKRMPSLTGPARRRVSRV